MGPMNPASQAAGRLLPSTRARTKNTARRSCELATYQA
jgi:hypothetical protein